MFNKARRPRTAVAPTIAAGYLQLPVTDNLHSVLSKLGQRWQCKAEDAAQRVVILALTGWTIKYAELLTRLSRFVPGHDDPFRRTCLMLRHHFDAAEVELGEPVRECDRIVWLETLLDALKERRADGNQAFLADLLADGALGAGSSM